MPLPNEKSKERSGSQVVLVIEQKNNSNKLLINS